ncbi:MAG: excalibur calcium-binding domain-containing protein [Alteraurantiacibacter sp. bin_em_oilr2.035]|nr:excalibur calcium-binding domain-containing protein [Alteraurantiacibacter sp. bin_em_oilr2.035]
MAADGCHTDRRTGTRHCHRGSNSNAQARQQRQIGGAVYYRNCDAARAAGAAPVRRGQPGYGPHLDRDNDGIGCE